MSTTTNTDLDIGDVRQLKPGYKKTPVGIIPEDWEVRKIGEIGEIFVGKDVKKEIYSDEYSEEYCYPVYSNTVDNYGLYGYYSKPEYKKGSVTIVGRGVGLGTAFFRNADFGAIGRLLILKPKKANNIFISEYINNKVQFFNESAAIPQLTGVQLKTYDVAIPPLQEQKSIANCLSTWDSGIEKLTQLIQAKKLRKKGLMQQLFNGQLAIDNEQWGNEQLSINNEQLPVEIQLKKVDNEEDRLKGWKKVELKECLKYEQPTQYLENIFDHIDNKNKTAVLTANQSFILGYTSNTQGVYKKLPVIIFDDFTTASRYIDFPFKVKSSAIKFLKEKQGYNLKFMFELLQTINHDISNHKRRWISEFEIKVIKVPSLQIQTAIAEILQAADKEIELLEQKLEAFKEQKKGLMQVLLTGERRLVGNEQ